MKTLKFMFMLAAAAAAGASQADVDSYLYWMADPAATYSEAGGAPGTPVKEYSYAKVSTDGGSTYLSLYGSSGSLGTDILDKGEVGIAGFSRDPAFSSFLFEFFNDNDDKVAWAALPYSQALQYIYSDPTRPGGTDVYSVSQVIPEPSSGLLLLLGMAGLALRRRRNAECRM